MKFCVRKTGRRSQRLGVLKDIEGRPGVEIETPLALLHTQGGHIPHITHEVFKLVSTEPQILQLSLVNMHCFQEAFDYYNEGVSSFIGNKDSLTCLTVHDPSSLTKQGHHIKDKVTIWTNHGKVLYDSELYMKLVEQFKPDMFYILADGDTNASSTQKRLTKSVENTVKFIKECLQIHKNTECLKNKFIMASIAGGYSLKARETCINLMSQEIDSLDGFLIDGLHNNGPEVELLSVDEVKNIVEFVLNRIPEEKLWSIQGSWNPLNVLKLVQMGVDMFDTSYCLTLTERSSVLTFNIEANEESDNYEINLKHLQYTEDFNAVFKNCICLTCSKYSRAYIHHLLSVRELLAPILIMIHNIHHYLRFFKKIRECIANSTLEELEERIDRQYRNHQEKILSKMIT